MATISIKLKAVLDKTTKDKIENAHILFNNNVRVFEEFLLLAQGKDYYYEDVNGVEQYKTEAEAIEQLETFIKNKNSNADLECCKQALMKLSGVIAEKGSQAAGMMAKLYNKDSSAGTNNNAKIVDPEPDWVKYYDLEAHAFKEAKYRDAADRWIKSEEGKQSISPIINGSGRPSAFKKAYTEGKEWYEKFIKDQNTYRKDRQDGLANILGVLEREKLLPVINIDKGLSEFPVWVKLYLKTALENYSSYLACDYETRKAYEKACEVYEEQKQKIEKSYAEEFRLVSAYLDNNYIEGKHTQHLTERMTRGLSDIFKGWKTCKTEEDRIKVLSSWQSDSAQKKKFGDVNFFRWMAQDVNFKMIDESAIKALLIYYSALRNKEQKRRCASYTVADPVLSKRYLFSEAPKGSNYRKYAIESRGGKLFIQIPVLLKDQAGKIKEEALEFNLASNVQFQPPYKESGEQLSDVQFVEEKKEVKVCFSTGRKIWDEGINKVVHENYQAKLGGADLRVETNRLGRATDVFVSITLSVDDICTEDFKSISYNVQRCFGTAYTGSVSKYASALDGKTLTALSIDLGLKQFGAVTVGSSVYDKTKILQDFTIERRFMLSLPGEKCSATVTSLRQNAEIELRSLRTGINYLSMLKRIYNIDNMEGRQKLLRQNLEYTKDLDKRAILETCLNKDSIPAMNQILSGEYSTCIRDLNEKMKEFRASEHTKKNSRNYRPGKSFWAIGYLESIRKLLMAWNSLSYRIEDENRTQSKEYGVIATRLLNHINHLKDDRIKTAADMLVQTARGYVYDENKLCWVKKYKTCNVIIFEDLSRYRFKSDRSKQENSKLMQWSHREIIAETKQQAELYGIAVYDSTDAALTSRYYYKTDAPGIRCDRLTKNDFEGDGRLKSFRYDSLPEKLKYYADHMKVGDLVPSTIGSLFLTLESKDKTCMVNADINAACNLQKRFWKQHTHLLRLKTNNKDGRLLLDSEVSEEEILDENNAANTVKGLGKRLKGQYLYHFGTSKLMLRAIGKEGHYQVIEREKSISDPDVPDKITYTLCNDPSGLFFAKNEWIGYTEFWKGVENTLVNELVKKLQ